MSSSNTCTTMILANGSTIGSIDSFEGTAVFVGLEDGSTQMILIPSVESKMPTVQSVVFDSTVVSVVASLVPGGSVTFQVVNGVMKNNDNQKFVKYLSNTYGYGITAGIIDFINTPIQELTQTALSAVQEWSEERRADGSLFGGLTSDVIKWWYGL